MNHTQKLIGVKWPRGGKEEGKKHIKSGKGEYHDEMAELWKENEEGSQEMLSMKTHEYLMEQECLCLSLSLSKNASVMGAQNLREKLTGNEIRLGGNPGNPHFAS